MSPKRVKRRQYIVDPSFQYRLISRLAVLAGLLITMSLSFLTLTYYLYGDIRIALVQPDPFGVAKGIDTAVTETTLLSLLWPVLGSCLLVTLCVMLFVGLLISHRMAGPVYRMRRALDEMSAGNLSGKIHLRKKDDFKHLADGINRLAESQRAVLERLRVLAAEMESGPPENQADRIRQLRKILAAFKTS